MVVEAKQNMLPQLKQLWQHAFKDGESYTDFIFQELLVPEKILVYLDKDKPVAMCCLEEMFLVNGSFDYPALFVHSTSIHPDYTGQGISTKLLEGVHKYAKKHGYIASVIAPETNRLFDYYAKRGYSTQFAVRQLSLKGQVLVPTGRNCILVPRSLDNLYEMRNQSFQDSKLFVKWSPAYLNFTYKDILRRKGEVLLVEVEGRKGYLVYRMDGTQAEITEFTLPYDCLDDVLATLHRRIGASMYRLRLRADYPAWEDSPVLPFAMIKWYDKIDVVSNIANAPYLSHVRD